MADMTVNLNDAVTRDLRFDLTDQDGNQMLLASLDALLLTVYNDEDSSLIRPTQPVLNANGVTVVETTDANGNNVTRVTWTIKPFESKIQNTTAEPGERESHPAYFELIWNSTASPTLSNPFTTTASSKEVIVNRTGHGLSVDEHVAFSGATDVGGVDMDGVYVITEVVDSDNFKVLAKVAATSGASGGGSPTMYVNPRTNKITVAMSVTKVDIT